MTETLEFSRVFDTHEVPPEGVSETIVATPDECDALAVRFGIDSMRSLSAIVTVQPWKRGAFRVRGDASAEIIQICVVTLEPFEQVVDVGLDQVFVEKSSKLVADDPEIIVATDEEDIGFIDEGNIELGEFAVETLCLELDPYPRKPGVEFREPSTDKAGGESGKENPFAVLKQLKLDNDE